MFEPILFDIEKGNQSNFSLFELKLDSGRKVTIFSAFLLDRVWSMQGPNIVDGTYQGFIDSENRLAAFPLEDGVCLIKNDEQKILVMNRETMMPELMFFEHKPLSFGGIFCFETGVVALAHDGEFLWKSKIYLNEKFKEERTDEIVFENAQDDYELMVDKESGNITR